MKERCKFCGRRIDTRGLLSHLHFKHRSSIVREFALNPMVVYYAEMWPPRFDQKALPAPNPLTVYSLRPLGYMARPIPELRRPKGYTLGYGYARPSDHQPPFWRKAVY